MDLLEFLKSLADPDTWLALREQLSFIGPLYGVLLTMVESFIPPLPLILFVTVNVFTFGFLWGSLASWLGTCLGSALVYLAFLKFGKNQFEKFEKKHDFFRRTAAWVHKKGVKVLFLLLCLPVTPSFLVNIFAAAVRLKPKEYLPILLGGRLVMVFVYGMIGVNLYASLQNPIRLIFVGIIAVLITLLAKHIYNKFNL